jgi:hypothetical protein
MRHALRWQLPGAETVTTSEMQVAASREHSKLEPGFLAFFEHFGLVVGVGMTRMSDIPRHVGCGCGDEL